MGREKVELGQKGEQIAEDFLLDNKYSIVERNFKFKNGEIDIICRNKDFLVFVEVKTRTGKYFGDPEFSITRKKRDAIYRTAEYYLFKNGIENVSCRIDVITILFDNTNSYKLNHYENI